MVAKMAVRRGQVIKCERRQVVKGKLSEKKEE